MCPALSAGNNIQKMTSILVKRVFQQQGLLAIRPDRHDDRLHACNILYPADVIPGVDRQIFKLADITDLDIVDVQRVGSDIRITATITRER